MVGKIGLSKQSNVTGATETAETAGHVYRMKFDGGGKCKREEGDDP